MRGPTPSAIDIELTLSDSKIKSGVDVNLYNFGTHYHGTVQNSNRIIWDRDPALVADATYSSSKIENYNSGIKITYQFYILHNGIYLDCEVIQTFRQK